MRNAAGRSLEKHAAHLPDHVRVAITAELLSEMARGLDEPIHETPIHPLRPVAPAPLEQSWPIEDVAPEEEPEQEEEPPISAETPDHIAVNQEHEHELLEGMWEPFTPFEQDEQVMSAAQDVLGMVLGSLRARFHRAYEELDPSARDRRVNLLERRAAKLEKGLRQTRTLLDQLASQPDLELGVASIYRTVQGLTEADPMAEAKQEMLVSIFETNLELQGKAA